MHFTNVDFRTINCDFCLANHKIQVISAAKVVYTFIGNYNTFDPK